MKKTTNLSLFLKTDLLKKQESYFKKFYHDLSKQLETINEITPEKIFLNYPQADISLIFRISEDINYAEFMNNFPINNSLSYYYNVELNKITNFGRLYLINAILNYLYVSLGRKNIREYIFQNNLMNLTQYCNEISISKKNKYLRHLKYKIIIKMLLFYHNNRMPLTMLPQNLTKRYLKLIEKKNLEVTFVDVLDNINRDLSRLQNGVTNYNTIHLCNCHIAILKNQKKLLLETRDKTLIFTQQQEAVFKLLKEYITQCQKQKKILIQEKKEK